MLLHNKRYNSITNKKYIFMFKQKIMSVTGIETETSGKTSEASSRGIVTQENITRLSNDLTYKHVRLFECEYDEHLKTFYYLCPCGDIFEMKLENIVKGMAIYCFFILHLFLYCLDVICLLIYCNITSGSKIASCQSCSLKIEFDVRPGDLDAYFPRT